MRRSRGGDKSEDGGKNKSDYSAHVEYDCLDWVLGG
jgi:hypothetical protein